MTALFDMSVDSAELHDLSDQLPRIVDLMREEGTAHLADAGVL